ncbi:unnamed protein product [Pleuronectes platessa]|uniref:Uncharacterized protein n=1 Tax=Pleuronectes platessa TaxID=8262 RepID=A0A9N7VRC6_PLEPL|nr:unnamed protein product [Pleuronectes platessa]
MACATSGREQGCKRREGGGGWQTRREKKDRDSDGECKNRGSEHNGRQGWNVAQALFFSPLHSTGELQSQAPGTDRKNKLTGTGVRREFTPSGGWAQPRRQGERRSDISSEENRCSFRSEGDS